MKLHVVDTGFFKLDGGAMFGLVPKTLWQKSYPADANNRCTWAMRCMLIEEGDRLILIDAGLGDKQSDKFFSHFEPHGEDNLLGSLRRLGFSETDVTDVILTHLHFDHCGGAVKRVGEQLLPQFPNAVYWSDEKHWDWAMTPNSRERASFLKENFRPIQEAGQLKFVQPGEKIHPAIDMLAVDGHTEHMLIPHIRYKDRTIVYMADLLPSPQHIPLPYVMAYDVRPLQTLVEKEAFLKRAVAEDYLLFFEHDKDVECCSLINTEKGIRMDTSGRLQEWL